MLRGLREVIIVVILATALVAAPLVLAAVVLVSGTLVSNLLVGGNGVENFEGEERAFAEAAAGQAEEILSEVPGPGTLTTGYRVVEVRACPDPPTYTPPVCRAGVCHVPRFHQGSEFYAELRTYTFFGITAGEMIMDCGGTTSMGR